MNKRFISHWFYNGFAISSIYQKKKFISLKTIKQLVHLFLSWQGTIACDLNPKVVIFNLILTSAQSTVKLQHT